MAIGTCTLAFIPSFMPETRTENVETNKELLEKEETAQKFTDTSDSVTPVSCLALGRIGEVYGAQCILDTLERETDV